MATDHDGACRFNFAVIIKQIQQLMDEDEVNLYTVTEHRRSLTTWAVQHRETRSKYTAESDRGEDFEIKRYAGYRHVFHCKVE